MALRRIDNPPNPYESAYHEWLEPPPPARVELFEEPAGAILSKNDSPDVGFRWSVNPYRGCQHGCVYCYARRTHEYLGFGAGSDFETKLIVKPNTPQRLDEAFRSPKWAGEQVAFSGVTDCYQPIEAVYGLTRACLDVCVKFRNPASVLTKSFLVVRDADVLAELARKAWAGVSISIPFIEPNLAKLMEPGAPPPARRFDAMRRLADAGVPVGILTGPAIPGLNDRDIPELLERAVTCGAQTAAFEPLRLPGNVQTVFLSRLRDALPMRYKRIENRIREIRGGQMNDSRFCHRMRGQGVYWESIRRLFELSARRHGLDRPFPAPSSSTFRVPGRATQLSLPFT